MNNSISILQLNLDMKRRGYEVYFLNGLRNEVFKILYIRSYKLAGFDRVGESQWELRHYDDVWQTGQFGTDINSFSERPYTATQDNLGNPVNIRSRLIQLKNKQ